MRMFLSIFVFNFSISCFSQKINFPAVAIHMGPAFPGAVYRGFPQYRVRLSNRLLLEDVLAKHPRLRICVMHAGWPMQQEMIGLMLDYPQVYADFAALDWTAPATVFHDYLIKFIDAGLGSGFYSEAIKWYGRMRLVLL